MAITATIARGYALRLIIIGVACTAFGVWGIYDYVYKIPKRQQLIARLDLLTQSRSALETEQLPGVVTPEAAAASKAVQAEFQRMLADASSNSNQPFTLEELNETVQGPDGVWLALLIQIEAGLGVERGLPLTAEAYPIAHAAYRLTDTAISQIAEVTAPGKYDRLMQWGFISCLPFGPYMFWVVARTRRQLYRLEEDGTLHLPEGTWKPDEVRDIDMSRWMAKSVAWVVNRDGTRVKLDDYKFKNLHLIVGRIAHRLTPEAWDEEARPRKDDENKSTPPAGSDDGSDAQPVIETSPMAPPKAEAGSSTDA